ncbi:MAG: SEC-C metal-binding domain-containing protein [Bacteriovorax sp.]
MAVKKKVVKKVAKKKVAKKAAPAKKKVAKKVAPVKKEVAKKTATKKIETSVKKMESKVSPAPKRAPAKKEGPVEHVIEGQTAIEENSFLKLKIAKSKVENPQTHISDHGEVHAEEEVPHEEPLKPIVRETPKVGRNEPCPCGSGLKYKKCHGKE